MELNLRIEQIFGRTVGSRWIWAIVATISWPSRCQQRLLQQAVVNLKLTCCSPCICRWNEARSSSSSCQQRSDAHSTTSTKSPCGLASLVSGQVAVCKFPRLLGLVDMFQRMNRKHYQGQVDCAMVVRVESWSSVKTSTRRAETKGTIQDASQSGQAPDWA